MMKPCSYLKHSGLLSVALSTKKLEIVSKLMERTDISNELSVEVESSGAVWSASNYRVLAMENFAAGSRHIDTLSLSVYAPSLATIEFSMWDTNKWSLDMICPRNETSVCEFISLESGVFALNKTEKFNGVPTYWLNQSAVAYISDSGKAWRVIDAGKWARVKDGEQLQSQTKEAATGTIKCCVNVQCKELKLKSVTCFSSLPSLVVAIIIFSLGPMLPS